MKFNSLISCAASCFAVTSLHAGEHTVQESVFEKTVDLEATFLPTEATVLKIDPQQWSSYLIQQLIDHGSIVKKGDILIKCDPEDYQKHLAETEKGVAARKIVLARSERELADLEITTPRALEQQRDGLERAKESLDYFTNTGRALEEETSRERLDSAERSLSYNEEELKQLLKMYEEDGVTEETEEIILKRQRSSVKSAKFALKRTKVSTAWYLEKTIPHKAIDLQTAFDSSTLAFETAKLNLPRILEEKRLSVAKAKRNDAIADEKLAKLKGDASFFTVTAPADGTVYYGKIDQGSWSLGQTAKFLMENGSLPVKSALMTFVPAAAPLSLYSSIGQDKRLLLKVGNAATATVDGLIDQEFTAQLTQLDQIPNGEGNYKTSFSVKLPIDSPILGGMKGKIAVVTYRNEKALTVPTSAITKKDGKSTVEVKLADGKNESREITTGQSTDGNTEVLTGLTVDQVVLTPES
jgi:HlyD family secretion protein